MFIHLHEAPRSPLFLIVSFGQKHRSPSRKHSRPPNGSRRLPASFGHPGSSQRYSIACPTRLSSHHLLLHQVCALLHRKMSLGSPIYSPRPQPLAFDCSQKAPCLSYSTQPDNPPLYSSRTSRSPHPPALIHAPHPPKQKSSATASSAPNTSLPLFPKPLDSPSHTRAYRQRPSPLSGSVSMHPPDRPVSAPFPSSTHPKLQSR